MEEKKEFATEQTKLTVQSGVKAGNVEAITTLDITSILSAGCLLNLPDDMPVIRVATNL
jgi:hypothetical protein